MYFAVEDMENEVENDAETQFGEYGDDDEISYAENDSGLELQDSYEPAKDMSLGFNPNSASIQSSLESSGPAGKTMIMTDANGNETTDANAASTIMYSLFLTSSQHHRRET